MRTATLTGLICLSLALLMLNKDICVLEFIEKYLIEYIPDLVRLIKFVFALEIIFESLKFAFKVVKYIRKNRLENNTIPDYIEKFIHSCRFSDNENIRNEAEIISKTLKTKNT